MSHLAFEPPMLAKLVRALPEGPEWEYELKLDGYRLQAIKNGDKVRLYSRRGNDFTNRFASIAAKVSRIKQTSFVLDGEAVAVDENGKPSFQMLQNRSSLPDGWSLAYYAFDPLQVEACPFSNLPTSKTGHWGEGVTADEMGDYVWLRPETVAQIMFAEWTTGGVLRHAEFVAVRDVKDPKEVIRESVA
jgi:bifunctional non-homologous end joining protein LigD